AYGIFKRRIWARNPIIISLLLLFVGSVYLIVHISNGGPYETKTVGAMAFRVVITLLLLFTTIKLFKMKKSILATLLGLAVVISCEQKHSTTETEDHADHTGHVVADTETQASDDDHADPSAALELDNGKKWTTNPEMLPYINEQK